ncbi:MAG TPA: TetR/AcrR family transcriptional regulator [Pseudonocardia sp.]
MTEPSPEYVRRRAEIIETGIKVFHDRGYDAGTLDDVAGLLDLRRASLYHYLGSKGELLYLIFDRAITTALGRLDEISAIADPLEQLAAFIAHQARMVCRDPGLFAVAFDQRGRLEEPFNAQILTKEREYLRRVTAMVERAAAAGELQRVDPRYSAHSLIGLTTWVYKWFDATRDNADDVARTMIRIVLGDRVDIEAALATTSGIDAGPARAVRTDADTGDR